MYDKWVVRGGASASIVVKRNDQTKEVVIGGSRVYIDFMEHVIEYCFGATTPENTHSQRGRLRFVLTNISTEVWTVFKNIAMEEMMGERVLIHGRKL